MLDDATSTEHNEGGELDQFLESSELVAGVKDVKSVTEKHGHHIKDDMVAGVKTAAHAVERAGEKVVHEAFEIAHEVVHEVSAAGHTISDWAHGRHHSSSNDDGPPPQEVITVAIDKEAKAAASPVSGIKNELQQRRPASRKGSPGPAAKAAARQYDI